MSLYNQLFGVPRFTEKCLDKNYVLRTHRTFPIHLRVERVESSRLKKLMRTFVYVERLTGGDDASLADVFEMILHSFSRRFPPLSLP